MEAINIKVPMMPLVPVSNNKTKKTRKQNTDKESDKNIDDESKKPINEAYEAQIPNSSAGYTDPYAELNEPHQYRGMADTYDYISELAITSPTPNASRSSAAYEQPNPAPPVTPRNGYVDMSGNQQAAIATADTNDSYLSLVP